MDDKREGSAQYCFESPVWFKVKLNLFTMQTSQLLFVKNVQCSCPWRMKWLKYDMILCGPRQSLGHYVYTFGCCYGCSFGCGYCNGLKSTLPGRSVKIIYAEYIKLVLS